MKNNIENKVKEVIDTNFEVEDINYVPGIDNSKLTFGNKGLRFTATVLYIDMRGSTKILNNHNRTTVAKLHMAYFHTIVKIATNQGGEVRSFNGDGMLVFFQGNTKDSLSNAVKASMQMKYMLASDDSVVKNKIQKYSSINFGIGLDHGQILCTKVGLSGTNNRDLVWIGNAVNRSVKVGDNLESPYHVGISKMVYNNLNDNVKYTTKKNMWNEDEKVDIWNEAEFTYSSNYETFYSTSYHFAIS